MQGGSPSSLLESYRSQLLVQSDQFNHDPSGKVLDPKIGDLLHPDKLSWDSLNEAEKRLARLFTDDAVAAEATGRFVEMEKLQIPTSATLKASYDDAKATPARKKALLATVLDELHDFYAQRRTNRIFRATAASRLNRIGVALLVPLVVILIVVAANPNELAVGNVHIALVLYFGAAGAYLSRLIDFQTSLPSLDYSMVDQNYSWWSIYVRLIIGIMGALVVYLLIRGGLLAGDLFPKSLATFLEPGAAAGAGGGTQEGRAAPAAAAAATETPLAGSRPMPTADFAKLLVWSLLGGFSERLVPDQLTRLTGSAGETKPTP